MKNLCNQAVFLFLLLLPALANATVTVTVTGTNVTCNGANNGTATAVASGGWAPYTYHWSTGATTATITGLAPGTYSVTVTDIDLGFATGQITITQPTGLGVTAYGSSQICGIIPDGTSTAVPYGGTPPYTYHWSNGGTTPQIIHLIAGIYTVTVTDANSCTAAAQDTIYFWNEGVWIMDSTVNVTCFGLGNGKSHVSGMSGTPPYMYTWSTGATTQDVAGLTPGNYTVTVKDANGCSNTHLVTVTQPPQLVLTTTTTPGNCGLAGSATVTASGGTPPYTIKWSTGSANSSITVGAGTYTVTITDAHGCATNGSATITVTPNTLLINTSIISKAGCAVGGSGKATVTGGTGPYSYSWSNGQTTATATNLPANTYTVTVVDITTGCTGTATVSIPNEPALSLTATVVTNATCAIGGSATATVSGGTPPYTYKWDNLQVTQTATNLAAGPHNVTITDALGCIATAAVAIAQTQGPTVTAQALSSATCTSGGSASATASAGTGPYTYLWSYNNLNTSTISNIPAGTYKVTVTDAGGCSASASVTITQTGLPGVVISSSTNSGCAINTGAATAGATGGTPPYKFKWNNPAGSTTPTVTNLGPGVYTVTITDAVGCTATTQVSIASSLPPNVVISASSNAKCDQPGSATVNASNGSGPYTYKWSDGELTATAVNFVNAGTYTVTVTDVLGCTATASVTIGFTGNGVKIGDFVWYDNDQDGFQAALETGVPGITVMLKKAGPDGLFGTADDIVVSTTTTNANGKYEFDCVTPGTYILMFTGIPAGYQWTGKNQVVNDCLDSDVNQGTGKTDAFTILAGQADDFCYDAGIHIKCDNVTNAGTICCDQVICEGQVPALLYPSLPPVGGSGNIQYQWLQLVGSTWTGIPGATNATYQPGALYQTSYFMRCAKREGCLYFVESNMIKITVKAPGSPNCDNFLNNWLVAPNHDNNTIQISWTTNPEAIQYMYSVEHSNDGLAWDVLSTVMGKGNANGANDYTAIDQAPNNGKNFYRIKRSASNIDDAYSDVKSTDLSMTVNESMSITPNPVTDYLHIHNGIKYDNDVVVTLLDTNGKSIDVVTIPSGTNEQLKLPMQNLPQGIYLVRVNFGNGKLKTLKITKY